MNPTRKLLLVTGVLMALPAIVGVAPAGAKTYVPFKGTNNAVLTITTPTAPYSPVYNYTGSGGGEATHLGRFAYAETGTLNVVTGWASGSFTYTAANGDTVGGTYAAEVFNVPTVTVQIDGGTGRFAGATGEVTVHIHLVGQVGYSFIYKNILTGVISTVGSG